MSGYGADGLFAEFLVTSLIVVLMPGTGVLFVVSTGLSRGGPASCCAAAGCTLGIVPHLTASAFGLAALLHTSALAFQCLKWVGVLYLAWLAWGMWRESGTLDFASRDREARRDRIVLRGFLINILNPKLSLFFLAFLPQFVPDAAVSPLGSLVFLSGLFMLMTLVVFVAYGVLADQFRRCATRSPRAVQRIQRMFSALFVVMGIRLAALER